MIGRIHTLNEKCVPGWGRMNIYQMVKHCTIWEEWVQGVGRYKYRQEFIGWLFGKAALKSIVKDEAPLRRNTPTMAAFKVKQQHGDVEAEKKKWISLIEGYAHYSNPTFIHGFFGKMTVAEIGILAYKHTDHHLRQFSC